jgi:hypothetical protein
MLSAFPRRRRLQSKPPTRRGSLADDYDDADRKTVLKLTVNEDKTRIRCRKRTSTFLGYSFGRMYSARTGRARLGYRAVEEKHQAHGGNHSCADGSNRGRLRHHRAGGEVEPHAARRGELLQCRHRHQSVSGDRQLHRCAVAPVVAHQAQGQATLGRELSTLAPCTGTSGSYV